MADIFGVIQQEAGAAREGVSSSVSAARRELEERQEEEEARLATEAGEAKGEIDVAESEIVGEATREVYEAEIRAMLPGVSRAEVGQARDQAQALEAAVQEAAVEAKQGVTEAELEALKALEEIFAEAGEELTEAEIEALTQVEGAEKEAIAELLEFRKNNVRLSKTGEWVDKAEFEALDIFTQKMLHAHGLEGYQSVIQEAQSTLAPYTSGEQINLIEALADNPQIEMSLFNLGISAQDVQDAQHFISSNIRLESTGDWIPQEDFNALDSMVQSLLHRHGIEGYKSLVEDAQQKLQPYMSNGSIDLAKAMEEDSSLVSELKLLGISDSAIQEAREFSKDNVYTSDGKWISEEWIDTLPENEQQVIENEGIDSWQEEFYITLPSGELIDKTSFEEMPETFQEAVMLDGLEAISMEGLTPEEQFAKQQDLGAIPITAEFAGVDEEGNITYIPDMDAAPLLGLDLTSVSEGQPQVDLLISKGVIPEGSTYFGEVPDLSSVGIHYPGSDSELAWKEPDGRVYTMKDLFRTLGQPKVSLLDFVPLAWIRNVDEMDGGDIATSVALDAVFIGTLFLGGAAIRGTTSLIRRASPTIRRVATLADEAGQAQKAMLSSVSKFTKADWASPKYAEVASKAQAAIDASKAADIKFLRTFDNLKSVTPGELKRFQRLSGIQGMADAAKGVQTASSNLEKAWVALDREVWGTIEYQNAMSKVLQAKNALSTSLESYSRVMSPRVAPKPHTGWSPLIEEAERNVISANRQLAWLRGHSSQASFLGESKDQLLMEAFEDLNFYEAELAMMREMAAAGEAVPEYTSAIMRSIRWGGQPYKLPDPYWKGKTPPPGLKKEPPKDYWERKRELEKRLPKVAEPAEIPDAFKKAFEVRPSLSPVKTPATAKPLGRVIPAPQIAVPGMVISNPKLIPVPGLGFPAYKVVEGIQIQIQSADGAVSYVSAESLSKMSPQQVRELLGETVYLKLRNGQLKPLNPQQAIEIARQADQVANIATETAFQAAARALAEGQNSAQAQALAETILRSAASETSNAFAASLAESHAKALSQAAAKTASEGYTRSQAKTLGEGETKGETKMEPLAKVDPYTQPHPVTMTETQTEAMTETQPQPQPLTITETAIQTKTATQLRTPKPMTTKIPLLLPILPDFAEEYQKRKKTPVTVEALEGAVTFRFGMRWVTVVPPYQNQDVFYTDMPIMESLQQEDVGKPIETLQVIRTAKEPVAVPREIWITDDSIGMFDVHIYNAGQAIRFVKKPPQPSALEIAESLEDLPLSEAREYLELLSPRKKKKVLKLLNVDGKVATFPKDPSPKWRGREYQPSVTELRNVNGQ